MGGGQPPAPGESPANPVVHKLESTKFSTQETPGANYAGWGSINDTIKTAGKYVILDLSDCTFEENTIEGDAWSGTTNGNRMNIISDNQFIKGVILPDGLASIGEDAFYQCASITSISIPASVNAIGDSAFAWCNSLTSLTIPSAVMSIDDYAFHECIGLTSIAIPANTSIGDSAFVGCIRLSSIIVDPANTAHSSEDGVLFNKNKTILQCYPAGKSGAYIIPNSVTSIGGSSFMSCASLTGVTIPLSVTSIEDNAFNGCSKLASVTFSISSAVASIGINAFLFSGLTSVTFQGNSIAAFEDGAFPADDQVENNNILRTKYEAGGAGTYRRSNGSSSDWHKL